MKIKSFALLAMTGLLAASCAYIAPAMADDTNNGGAQAAPSDQLSAPAEMSNSSPQTNDNMSMNMSADNNSGGNNNTDQASPDTATGDDDY